MYIIFSGEPGVFIGKIIPTNPARAFLGYVNEKESKKKVVHDVFTKGDSAFLSGIVESICCRISNSILIIRFEFSFPNFRSCQFVKYNLRVFLF